MGREAAASQAVQGRQEGFVFQDKRRIGQDEGSGKSIVFRPAIKVIKFLRHRCEIIIGLVILPEGGTLSFPGLPAHYHQEVTNHSVAGFIKKRPVWVYFIHWFRLPTLVLVIYPASSSSVTIL